MTDDVSMNKELKKWIQKTKKNKEKLEEKKESKRKEFSSGKCEICGNKTAKHVCLKCGRSVCPSCYFKIVGVCKKCVPDEIAAKWEGKQPDWEDILGVEWVD